MAKPNPMRSSLQAVLERQARSEPAPSSEPIPETSPPLAAKTVRREHVASAVAESAKFHRPSREGRRLIAGHFDPRVAKQLKVLAAEEDTTVQSLLEEALNLLFVKKGKDTIKRA